LKHLETKLDLRPLGVAPHAGAWIETCMESRRIFNVLGRAPRGRVD